jgi:hypothetical protein
VTIGPLVELWMLAAERDAPPTASELAAARQRVGADRISVVSGEGVSLGEAGMKLDLGGISKGYALDRMLPLLERHGIESALLNFGQSSTWAVGAPAGSAGWRLLVRGPEGRFAGLITLRDQALSVSGSQGQWIEIGGRRYGHIIDPRSGEPLMRARQAVVVSRRAVLAEALSLALLVLDAETGLALVAAQPDCEGLLIEGGGALRSTPGWEAAVRFEPLSAPGEGRSSSSRNPPISRTWDWSSSVVRFVMPTSRSVVKKSPETKSFAVSAVRRAGSWEIPTTKSARSRMRPEARRSVHSSSHSRDRVRMKLQVALLGRYPRYGS